MKALAAAAIFILVDAGTSSHACEIASVLFGKVKLDVIRAEDYETSLVREGGFDNPQLNYGAFRGEITVDRGGFSVRNTNQVVVGTISPSLQVDGFDEDCDKASKVQIKKIQSNVYVIMNGGNVVGTIEGRFPHNDFGVR